jgi:Holliday junction resolvase-like predicted endonuclease
VTWEHLLAAAIAGALLALVVLGWVRRWRGTRRAQRRARRALAGEHGAAGMLERAGYRIVARQARAWWAPVVDGEPHEIEVRVDYLVEAGGALYVAEVKTGEQAPQLATAATRRQLLEYHVAFASDGVLLVCPERGTIHVVEFPGIARDLRAA